MILENTIVDNYKRELSFFEIADSCRKACKSYFENIRKKDEGTERSIFTIFYPETLLISALLSYCIFPQAESLLLIIKVVISIHIIICKYKPNISKSFSNANFSLSFNVVCSEEKSTNDYLYFLFLLLGS